MSSENPDNNKLVRGGSSDPPSLLKEDVDILREMIYLQREQATAKQEEIEIEKQRVANEAKQAENAHEYALTALKAMAEDRKDIRATGQTGRRDKLKVGVLAGIAIVILACFAMYLDKDEIAFEVVKTIGLVAIGAFGGYSYGSKTANEQKPKEEKD